MRMNFRVDSIDGGHSRLSLFVNGGKAGDIVLRNEEVDDLRRCLQDAPAEKLLLQLTYKSHDKLYYERTI